MLSILVTAGSTSLLSQETPVFTLQARIDEPSLGESLGATDRPILQSFDLAADGKSVVLLVAAGGRPDRPLWLLVEDLAKRRIIASRNLGPSRGTANFAPQVLYASDQQSLVVQDNRQIRVIDRQTLNTVGTIPAPLSTDTALKPLFVLGASDRNVFVCAFGQDGRSNPYFHTTPVEVEIVSIPDAKILSHWSSEDVPQAVSPDGQLIAVSSARAQGNILPLLVRDVPGRQVVELTGGFAFKKKARQPEPFSRVRGVFVDADHMILSPDEGFDENAQYSGDGLRLVNVRGSRADQVVHLTHFAPTGELAVSADHKSLTMINRYAPPEALLQALKRRHGPMPAETIELWLFSLNPSLRMKASIPIQVPVGVGAGGLKASGWLAHWLPHISADGSVIAAAVASDISIWSRNAR